jgi:predicted secreted protein
MLLPLKSIKLRSFINTTIIIMVVMGIFPD